MSEKNKKCGGWWKGRGQKPELNGKDDWIHKWYGQLAPGEEDFLSADKPFEAFAEMKLRENLPGLRVPAAYASDDAPSGVRIKSIYRWTAAAVLVGIIILAAFYRILSPENHPASSVSVVLAGKNEIRQVLLPDSSIVILNRLSRLEWHGDFNGKSRKVILSGEARFDIRKNTGKPFIVMTGGTETAVLGTLFNVEAYEGEQEVKVSLISGSVRFSPGRGSQQPAILRPGKMIRYSKATNGYAVNAIENKADGWVNGAVVFNEVPLKDAISRICTYAGWKLIWKRNQDRDAQTATISAAFNHETPLQMVKSISFTDRLNYTIKGDSLIIH